jgi:eukaryotic-like serine/threonine-protein kinase
MTSDDLGRDGEPTAPLPLSTDHLAEGRYELGETLGSGGMGIVRKAYDHRLGRSVAIKLLADNLAADPIARERFLREARAAAAIADPNVVAVYDVGDEAGRPYLVMELVNGPSLAALLREQGPLPVSRVTEIAADALAGLEATHAAGIVHRDVKPGNLLQTPSGQVKLTDLGVAEAADAPGLTRTGMVVGTRTYLAPERRAGGTADVRTDLYALGVTFTELLFGPAPEDPQHQVEAARWLPQGLRTLVLQLLAGDAAHRPVSAAAARKLLEAGTTGAAVATPVGDEPAADNVAAPPAPDAAATQAAEQTQTLPADDDVDDGEAEETWVAGADESRSTGAVTEAAPASPSAGLATTTTGRWWVLGVAAFIGLGLLVNVFRGDPADGGNEEPPPEEAPAAEVVDAPTVPRDDDPATTARNLAEWLRDR